MEILDNWGEKNIKISSNLSGDMTKSMLNIPSVIPGGGCADKCPPNTFGGCGKKDTPTTIHLRRRMSSPGLRKDMRSGYNSMGTLPVLVREGCSNRAGNMVLKSHIPAPRSSRSGVKIPGTETKMVPPRININRRVINRDREMSMIKRDGNIDICRRVQSRREEHVSGNKMSEDLFDNIVQEVNSNRDRRVNSPRDNRSERKHQHDIPGIVNSDGAEYKINPSISFKRDGGTNIAENKQKKVVFDNISCVNCKNCTGCKNCFGCVDCNGCMNCSDCVGCSHCKNCMGLKNRMYAHDEYDVRKSCSLDMKVMDEMCQDMNVEISMK